MEVLAVLMTGATNREIGVALRISAKTAGHYICCYWAKDAVFDGAWTRPIITRIT